MRAAAAAVLCIVGVMMALVCLAAVVSYPFVQVYRVMHRC